MPVTEKQLVDAANSFVGYANKGKFDPKVWELVADPATFVFIDGFGASFGKEECQQSMTEWVEDRGLQMKPGDAKVRINMYPGIHEVETPVDFKLSKAMVQGVPTEFPGIAFYTFNDDGKMIRYHSHFAGPKVEELNRLSIEGIIKSHGGKVPGHQEAGQALKDLLASIKIQDPQKFADLMTEDAVVIDPVNVTIGKPSIPKTMATWYASGMRGAVAVHDPVPLKPYRVRVYVDYEFSGLPEDAPVTQHTVGTVIVDVDRGSGKIKRCVAVPHEEKNRKWNPDLINWLVEKQKLGEKTGKAA